jgi:penicillin amidase
MRTLLKILGALLFLFVLVGLAAYASVRRSLPPDDERRALHGLDGEVTIEYDSLGVPTIRATTLNDLAFGQGYAHARDRRFQMELIRRSAAGRLAEVFGPRALAADREKRLLGFGAVADTAYATFDTVRKLRFEAYAAGVNAFDSTHAPAVEFLALGIPRTKWRPQDAALVIASMFYDLQYDGNAETMVEQLDESLPGELVTFLTPERCPDEVLLADRTPYVAPPLPPPSVFDARSEKAKAALRIAESRAPLAAWLPGGGEPPRGSNNWAIAPSRTAHGRAILCGDPHLGLRVPPIWHRQRLVAPGISITGVTLPGVPDVVIGSNGRVAWSFTNVEGDFLDQVRLRTNADTTTYAGPGGEEPFRIRREIISVKGGHADTLNVRETRWGPVTGRAPDGTLLALEWSALFPRSYDFDLLDEDLAASVDSLFRAFDGYRGPAQNVVAADAAGHIGWRIAGRVPRRAGFDSRRPRDGALAAAGWFGEVPQDSMPRVIDPPEGLLATANQRTLGTAWARIGHAAGMPWRARRIHDVLASRADWDVAGAAALQNDLEDAVLGPTAAALARALTPAATEHDSTLARARRLLERWEHRADTTSATHAFLRYARVALHQLALEGVLAPCVVRDSTFVYDWNLEDEVVRRLLTERPVHLLSPRFESWDALALAAVDSAAARLERAEPGRRFDLVTWGMINRARIRHPLGAAVPALGKWLDMPDAALAGGQYVVRVARPSNGASLRMVVELGSGETRFSLPGGESGNFLSKHYADEFADWVAGRYVPLDPGRTRHTLRLRPARK